MEKVSPLDRRRREWCADRGLLQLCSPVAFFFDDLPVVTWLGRHTWGRRLIWSALGGAIVLQNVFFLNHQRSLFTTLNRVYQQVLDAAEEEQIDHRSVWLTVYQDEQFLLKLAGAVTPAAALTAEPLVRFEGGPIIESAIVKQHRRDEWAVTLTLPGGSGPYTVQVGVYNAGGRLPAYADGVRALDDAASVVTIQP